MRRQLVLSGLTAVLLLTGTARADDPNWTWFSNKNLDLAVNVPKVLAVDSRAPGADGWAHMSGKGENDLVMILNVKREREMALDAVYKRLAIKLDLKTEV